MKLRYTPFQVKCWCAEEEDAYGPEIHGCTDLGGMPVIAGTLHSQLPAIAAGLKQAAPWAKIAYIMTDGAALPIAFSKLVRTLKDKGLIDATITVGHAFGGDYDAVTIYSGLSVAKAVAKADAVIVCMGPGIVGTGTQLGFTGVEQADILHAAHSLKAHPIAVPRLSFADRRERHYGVSHHTLTILGKLTLIPVAVVLPHLPAQEQKVVMGKLKDAGICDRHKVYLESGQEAIDFLQAEKIKVTTMGRSIEEDKQFFLSAGACGRYAAKLLNANEAENESGL